MSEVSLQESLKTLKNLEPRPFDIWILPGFLVFYSFRSKSMPRLARRILFTSGVLMGLRNIDQYKQIGTAIRERMASGNKQS